MKEHKNYIKKLLWNPARSSSSIQLWQNLYFMLEVVALITGSHFQ